MAYYLLYRPYKYQREILHFNDNIEKALGDPFLFRTLYISIHIFIKFAVNIRSQSQKSHTAKLILGVSQLSVIVYLLYL